MSTPSPSAMRALGALLQLTDSALPTGAFSHSFGLESALDASTAGPGADPVTDEHVLRAWLAEYLALQLASTDAVIVRRAWRAESDADLISIDAELGALLVPRQIREASLRMGRRLIEIATEALPSPGVERYAALVASGSCSGHAAIAFALAAAGRGIDADTATEAYLHATVLSLVTNAVRAIPLGQLAGQRVIAALDADVREAAARSAEIDRDPASLGFGVAAPALEIHQMRHEHLHARMFAS